ncbi:Hypothetical_protein [Hexamita inflata]|uniref:Hypothetical_protein n=1 Tax=Hexamita inflata TaxID=28002 RepID=A0AA86RHR2_9EUKA|nr:Hypothetical protein HINF_LOCUS64407 [Hexamita inflata]
MLIKYLQICYYFFLVTFKCTKFKISISDFKIYFNYYFYRISGIQFVKQLFRFVYLLLFSNFNFYSRLNSKQHSLTTLYTNPFYYPLQTYYHNHTQNLPKLQIPVLEKLQNEQIVTPYKNSSKSDSLDLFSFSLLKVNDKNGQLTEQINKNLFQLRIQIKRIQYLNGCNDKNENVINRVQKNMMYLQQRSK